MKKPFVIVTLSTLLTACASMQSPSAPEATPLATAKKPALAKPVAAKGAAKVTDAAMIDPLPAAQLTEDILFKTLSSEIAFQRGQWEAPYVTLLSTAQQTRDPRLARRAAEMALAARRPVEALAAVRLWTELAPHSEEALQNYLGLIMLSDNISEIEPVLVKRLANVAPQARGPMILQVQRLLARAKDKAAAYAIMQTLVAPYANLMESHLALAQAAAANRDAERALAEAEQAIKINPHSELAILTLAQMTSDADAALKLVADFLKKNPDAREVRIAYARGLVEQKQFEQARAQFQTLLKDDQNDLTTLYALGILNAQTNHLPEAESYLKRYVAILTAQPEENRDASQALLLLSQIAEERKDTAAALKWLEQVEPGEAYVGAQVRRAQLLTQGGNMAAAREVLQQAGNATDNNQYQLQLIQAEAQLLRDAGRNQETADTLANGLKRFPNNTDLLYDYAMALDKIANFNAMEDALRKIIALAPNNQNAYNALGYSFADRNIRLPEAIALIKKAVQLAPDDAFIADSLGWAEFRIGNLKEAEKQLRRAYSLRQDPEIGVHLGEILWARGQHEEARKLWREAQSKDPANEVLKSTLSRLQVTL